MNTMARIKKIEQKMSSGKQEKIVVSEHNGEYYIIKNGKKVVIEDPEKSFPDKSIIILRMNND